MIAMKVAALANVGRKNFVTVTAELTWRRLRRDGFRYKNKPILMREDSFTSVEKQATMCTDVSDGPYVVGQVSRPHHRDAVAMV